MSRRMTKISVLIGAAVAVGAALLSLGFVPSVRRYVRMTSM